jgi:carbon storage regulator CsrA
MLVLTRRPGEKIILLGPNNVSITLTMIDLDHDRGRLGIDAPDSVLIWREELLDRAKPTRGRRVR